MGCGTNRPHAILHEPSVFRLISRRRIVGWRQRGRSVTVLHVVRQLGGWPRGTGGWLQRGGTAVAVFMLLLLLIRVIVGISMIT